MISPVWEDGVFVGAEVEAGFAGAFVGVASGTKVALGAVVASGVADVLSSVPVETGFTFFSRIDPLEAEIRY